MGLFDDTSSGKRDEVRIGVSEKDENDGSQLKSDVEKRIGSKDSSSSSGSSVSVEDIHQQNERIIELLESLVDDKRSSDTDIGDPGSISDRRSNDTEDDKGMRGGMDELL